MTPQDQKLVLQVCEAMLDVIKAKGEQGEPLGYLYAHVMHAMSLEAFYKIMDMLQLAGRITVSNNCAFYVERRPQ
jgi:hypothetical protein